VSFLSIEIDFECTISGKARYTEKSFRQNQSETWCVFKGHQI